MPSGNPMAGANEDDERLYDEGGYDDSDEEWDSDDSKSSDSEGSIYEEEDEGGYEGLEDISDGYRVDPNDSDSNSDSGEAHSDNDEENYGSQEKNQRDPRFFSKMLDWFQWVQDQIIDCMDDDTAIIEDTVVDRDSITMDEATGEIRTKNRRIAFHMGRPDAYKLRLLGTPVEMFVVMKCGVMNILTGGRLNTQGVKYKFFFLFDNASQVAAILDTRAATWAPARRLDLGIRSNSKTRMVGQDITLEFYSGSSIQGGTNVVSVPSMDHLKKVTIDTDSVFCIAYVESETFLERIAELIINYESILKRMVWFTAKGQPCVSCRDLLATIAAEFVDLPAVLAVDCNVGGVKIGSTINDGSLALFHENDHLAARRFKLLALPPEDVDQLQIPRMYRQATTAADEQAEMSFLKQFITSQEAKSRASAICKSGFKAELESIEGSPVLKRVVEKLDTLPALMPAMGDTEGEQGRDGRKIKTTLLIEYLAPRALREMQRHGRDRTRSVGGRQYLSQPPCQDWSQLSSRTSLNSRYNNAGPGWQDLGDSGAKSRFTPFFDTLPNHPCVHAMPRKQARPIALKLLIDVLATELNDLNTVDLKNYLVKDDKCRKRFKTFQKTSKEKWKPILKRLGVNTIEEGVRKILAQTLGDNELSQILEEDRPHKCDGCHRSFFTILVLEFHKMWRRCGRKLEEKELATSIKCDKGCGRPFPSLRALELHWRRSECGANNPRYVCDGPGCKKRYEKEADLLKHKVKKQCGTIQLPPDSMQCDGCGRAYKRRASYVKHKIMGPCGTHPIQLPDERWCSCRGCKQFFLSEKLLRFHIGRNPKCSPGTAQSNGDGQLQCDGCQRFFAGQYQLSEHKNKRPCGRPAPGKTRCQRCGQDFKRQRLATHECNPQCNSLDTEGNPQCNSLDTEGNPQCNSLDTEGNPQCNSPDTNLGYQNLIWTEGEKEPQTVPQDSPAESRAVQLPGAGAPHWQERPHSPPVPEGFRIFDPLMGDRALVSSALVWARFSLDDALSMLESIIIYRLVPGSLPYQVALEGHALLQGERLRRIHGGLPPSKRF
ncbi:hypothetical protein NMY22_g17728 [Coprinellus aureogranulatus]|nr:hypothetical protein NMY22_g17728 [Coprinellus aureogranulatus]